MGAWCANTRECLAMLLRPGNAGSNTFTDHRDVLAAAIRQIPARFRRKILVRMDGAGASHDLIKHLLAMSSPRRAVLFTCGWMITAADDEDAIRQVPAAAWKPGTGQDGVIEQDKAVAEITAHSRPARPARPRTDPEDQPGLALEGCVPYLLAAALRPASTRLTSTISPSDRKGDTARRGRSRCAPGHPRAPPRDRPRKANRQHARNRAPAQSVTGPQGR
ncbi:MAG TPA: hypothetical protein VFQ68_17895 [Streptosporangiaceae bacterium]|nr:hypothetical protein [Streptosporangiaceae bacterium]